MALKMLENVLFEFYELAPHTDDDYRAWKKEGKGLELIRWLAAERTDLRRTAFMIERLIDADTGSEAHGELWELANNLNLSLESE